MSRDKIIADANERAELLKRQRRLQLNREKEQQRKIDTRLKIIIGSIVVQYLPGVTCFQPKLSQSENAAEFAELGGFVSKIANDLKYAALFQEIVRQKTIENGEASSPQSQNSALTHQRTRGD